MIKRILFFLLISSFLSGCEKDDICLSPTTPKLILRFYDASTTTAVKSVPHFSVIASGKTDSLFTAKNTDSIAIPLDVNASETTYIFKTSSTGNLQDNRYNNIKLRYTTEDVFVSRSCGFKTIFKDISIEAGTDWFQSFTPNSITVIDHETAAHVKIYH